MATIGEVIEIPWEFVNQWKIQDFDSLSSKEDESYTSPSFSFAGTSWNLKIYPNGETEITPDDGPKVTSVGYIDIYLHRKSPGPPISLEYSLGIKTLDEKIDSESHLTYTFENTGGYGYYRLLERSDLLKRKSELMPSGALTVICKMRYPKSATPTNDEFLCQDLKKMLLDGLNHDLILKIGDKELRAHKDILRARSRVFESMLTHDMAEKDRGVIDIPDCDPQSMEQFLSYVYSGKIEIPEQCNMLKLYYIADKYDVKGLKGRCCDFIKHSLSLTNFYEVIQLALNHSDSSLLEYATEYFKNNIIEIMGTVEWQCFLKDNSTVANELLLKSIKMLKSVGT